jgi:hypothetical protein
MTRAPALAAVWFLALPLAAAGCAARAGLVAQMQGTITVDRAGVPPDVYLEDSKEGRWRLEGPGVEDLRELDRAVVEVQGLGRPRDPLKPSDPGRFELHAYRLVRVGGKPALVGMLAWEGSDLMLVELDRDDRRVVLGGPMLAQLPSLMGKAIWVAGEPRQGVFVVERYGVVRR